MTAVRVVGWLDEEGLVGCANEETCVFLFNCSSSLFPSPLNTWRGQLGKGPLVQLKVQVLGTYVFLFYCSSSFTPFLMHVRPLLIRIIVMMMVISRRMMSLTMMTIPMMKIKMMVF